MAARVTGSRLSAQAEIREDRIGDMLRKGTIDRALANNQKAALMLNSDTLRDFLKAYPDYKIRDGHLPPFFKGGSAPDIECLIACINCQWARHYLINKQPSTENIQSIGPNSVLVWQTQVPEILGILFDDNNDGFLKADVHLQQTIALMTQDYVEALNPKLHLPEGFQAIVRDWESEGSATLFTLRRTLTQMAQQKLDRIAQKGGQEHKHEQVPLNFLLFKKEMF